MKNVIDHVVSATELTKKDVKAVVEAIFSAIALSLKEGNGVSIHGFGKFEIKERPARTGRNPKTGETIQIAASKGVSFKAAKALKEQI